ncbi:hypothetical protein EVAR_19607_1 [Eumeta japonica]|uniref:Uncharacterized protein n=1 Tax=Eumeta variegata TaxID=151549 RepID=A0A4C1UGP0_EUMVA|nr:hypothetical protein EVAR_19607_1 [Eumeta japonica]
MSSKGREQELFNLRTSIWVLGNVRNARSAAPRLLPQNVKKRSGSLYLLQYWQRIVKEFGKSGEISVRLFEMRTTPAQTGEGAALLPLRSQRASAAGDRPAHDSCHPSAFTNFRRVRPSAFDRGDGAAPWRCRRRRPREEFAPEVHVFRISFGTRVFLTATVSRYQALKKIYIFKFIDRLLEYHLAQAHAQKNRIPPTVAASRMPPVYIGKGIYIRLHQRHRPGRLSDRAALSIELKKIVITKIPNTL